jgi:chaperonin GroES
MPTRRTASLLIITRPEQSRSLGDKRQVVSVYPVNEPPSYGRTGPGPIPPATTGKNEGLDHFEQISLVSGSKSTTSLLIVASRAPGARNKTRKIGGRTMKFRPLHDRVVVKRVEEEGKTKGGIFIPDTAKEKPMEGEIVAVGPGARDEKGTIVPLDVKKGDRILFGKWSGSEVKLDGEDLLIMKESDVMGVIEGPTIAIVKKKAA